MKEELKSANRQTVMIEGVLPVESGVRLTSAANMLGE